MESKIVIFWQISWKSIHKLIQWPQKCCKSLSIRLKQFSYCARGLCWTMRRGIQLFGWWLCNFTRTLGFLLKFVGYVNFKCTFPTIWSICMRKKGKFHVHDNFFSTFCEWIVIKLEIMESRLLRLSNEPSTSEIRR